MLKLEGVAAGYAGQPLLDGVSFTALPGKIHTLIGNNGCGKTTILKTILGLLPLSAGEITLDDTSLSALSPNERAKRLAYLSQGKQIPDISVERMVLHGRFPYLAYPRRYREKDWEIARQTMASLELLPLVDRPLTTLSGGMRQRVYLAMALAQQAPVLLMDEPTAYLDIAQQYKWLRLVRSLADEGKTVVLVLHDLLLALTLSDTISVVQEGKIRWSGSPMALLETSLLPEAFGVTVGTVTDAAGEHFYYRTIRE